jgi:hypothetical protein
VFVLGTGFSCEIGTEFLHNIYMNVKFKIVCEAEDILRIMYAPCY